MTAAYQPNSVQSSAYQAGGGIALPAYQNPPFQGSAFQARILADIPAFQEDTFQYDPLAFQMAIPVPPEPVIHDGHDGGRKKALKKLKELEDRRIEIKRAQDEDRKMAIRFAIDPEAKAAFEAKLVAANKTPDAPKADRTARDREIAKIDMQIARVEKMQKNAAIRDTIRQELNRINSERQLREAEIAYQIKQADEELALLMLM